MSAAISDVCENTKIISCHDSKDESHHCGQIDIIDVPVDENCKYKYFFVYEDQLSKFVVLRALRRKTPKEVALKLIDILAIIGAPQVLWSRDGRHFVKQVVHEMKLLWDGLLMSDGDIANEKLETRDFKKLLKNWLERNPNKTWYEGLKFIQVLENTTFCCSNNNIPCNKLFGQPVRNAFQRLPIHSELRSARSVKLNSDPNFKNEDPIFKQENTKNDDGTDSSFIVTEHTYSQSRGSESDADSETTRTPHAFNFVNVKSELPINVESGDTNFEDEQLIEIDTKPDTEIEDLKCKICMKQYTKQGHLKNHMKTHSGEKSPGCKTLEVDNLQEKQVRQSQEQGRLIISSRTRQSKNKLSENIPDIDNLNCQDGSATEIDNPEAENIPIDNSKESGKELNAPGKRKLSSENRTSKRNGDPSLECTYCKQKFSFPSVLKRHMRSHTNERPYICEVCNKSFKQLGHLSQHSLTHKDYRSFQCAFCGIKFETLDSLKTHSQTHKGESVAKTKGVVRLFECDNCKKVFTTKSVLERHIFTHTHERQFGCKVCGKRFKQAGHVKSHMLVHTGERRFECTVCSKRFSLANSLKKHMYVHNGEKPYQCDVCGARFLEKRNLNGHLMTHTNERPFRCKICGKRYTLADTLRRHISAAHEDGRTYQCEICAKMFKQLAHLSVHKKVHNDERPFQCHLCEKTFKHKNVLKSHLAIHANVRPFECDVCKATFVRKTNLQTHIASAHMNERPYACTICGKRFKQISHLNGHVVVHSNSMPYQCDFCDRRCNRLDNLKKHMRLHTKNKE